MCRVVHRTGGWGACCRWRGLGRTLELLDDREAGKDERGAQHDGDDQAPFEDARLGAERRLEVVEYQREHEEVVDRQRLLEDVGRKPRGRRLLPLHEEYAGAEDERRGDKDARLRQRRLEGVLRAAHLRLLCLC